MTLVSSGANAFGVVVFTHVCGLNEPASYTFTGFYAAEYSG